jgi:prepilin-type N-terminal cleavage/methylation domain-containing protein
MRTPHQRRSPEDGVRHRPVGPRGLTLIEILVAMTILAVGLLGIAGMFETGYKTATAGGKMTLALTGARQMLEDIRTLPTNTLGNLDNLNGFDTNSSATQPADSTAPEWAVARKWRYALAGDGVGWGFTTAEKAKWSILSSEGTTFGGRGQISVVNQSATLRLVTVTVAVPGRGVNIQLATLISAM